MVHIILRGENILALTITTTQWVLYKCAISIFRSWVLIRDEITKILPIKGFLASLPLLENISKLWQWRQITWLCKSRYMLFDAAEAAPRPLLPGSSHVFVHEKIHLSELLIKISSLRHFITVNLNTPHTHMA